MMTKAEMTQAEFIEIIAQCPKTKAEIISRVEAEIRKALAQANERNQKLMEQAGCSDLEIDLMKSGNDERILPAILQALHTLGINLAYGPERKQ